jgi:uncharacterized protein with HEPN domain
MSNRREQEYLTDIVEAGKRIASYLANIEYEAFLQDTKTQDAVVRNLEIIGEAVKHVSEEVRNASPRIPWKSIAGMRDKLIHDYFGVNLDIVWNIVKKDLPSLLDYLETYREHERSETQ